MLTTKVQDREGVQRHTVVTERQEDGSYETRVHSFPSWEVVPWWSYSTGGGTREQVLVRAATDHHLATAACIMSLRGQELLESRKEGE